MSEDTTVASNLSLAFGDPSFGAESLNLSAPSASSGSSDPQGQPNLNVSKLTQDSLSADASQDFGLPNLNPSPFAVPVVPSEAPALSGANGSDFGLPNLNPSAFTAGTVSQSTSSILSTSRASTVPIYVRTFDGKPVTIKRKAKVSRVARDALAARSSQRMSNLLDVPIHRLMESAKTVSATAKCQEPITQKVQQQKDHSLWVDRYRPQRFTELTGNERVAREALAWVKQWDFCVFGKGRGKKRTRDGNENTYVDEYRRPREKLLLLSGPPGLGKTTLAHVVALQAGYDVMEINASDARSGQEVETRIKPALESGSAIGSKKPVLLVLDEIDGASGSGDNSSAFINKLVQLTFDRPKKKKRAGQPPDSKRPLLRPIICVCNDPNASSLARLRPVAFHIRFSRPADVHTVTRLREICELEGLRADARALSTLVGVAKGDLRGCINTLQFIKARHNEVTEGIIRGATLGMKENESSLNNTLNSLFNPLSKRRTKELALSEEEESRYVSRLVKEIDSVGKEAALAIGCFSHYITRRQHDAHFKRYEQACDWLTTFDQMSSHMYTDGDFATLAYLPYTLVPFYSLFQERGSPLVERSTEDWENLQTTRANEEIYKSLIQCIRAASASNGGDFRNFVTTPNLQLEFAPFLNRIISPPLRPINQQVVRAGEREILTRLVNLMSGLKLQFLQERAEDGQLTYRLDPPIDVFVTYDGKRASDIAVSRYAFRHMVAGELQAKAGSPGMNLNALELQGSPTKKGGHALKALADSVEPASKKARTNESLDITEKAAVDFFGRPIITKPGDKHKKSGRPGAPPKAVERGFRVAFKFLEGNSAAVRKPMKLEAFM